MLGGQYTVEGSTEIAIVRLRRWNFDQGWIANLSTVHCTVIGEDKCDNDPIIM